MDKTAQEIAAQYKAARRLRDKERKHARLIDRLMYLVALGLVIATGGFSYKQANAAPAQPPAPVTSIVARDEVALLNLHKQLLSAHVAKKEDAVSFDVPSDIETHAKRFMDYRAITDKTSTQWEMQQGATTNEEGFRMLSGRYMVAMGTYYAPYCGRVFRITLDSGKQFECVIGDIKSDMHTDTLRQHRQGNVVEFIVDSKLLPDLSSKMGDVSWSPAAGLRGNVEAVELLYSPY